MMNEDKLLTVARYLEDDMEPQEKQSFEVLLQTDVELQGLVAEYKHVHQTLKMKISPLETDQEIAATLSSLNKQYFKDEVQAPRVLAFKPYLKWMSMAAVLLIGLLIWAPWSTSIYEKYSISKEMSVAERGGAGKPDLDRAAELYNAGDFEGAKHILQQAHTLEPENSMLAYYYGITLMETGKTRDGRDIFTQLYAGESVFKYDAAYCAALSYIKEKNEQQALTWLEKIPEDSPNYEKARAFMTELAEINGQRMDR